MKLALAIALVSGPVFALAASCSSPLSPQPQPPSQPTQPLRARASDWLAAAGEAAQWLDHNSIDTEHGIGWRADPSTQAEVDRTLYAGSPGVVLFFLELAHATGDADALAMARAGTEDLLATLPDHVDGEAAGLYTGLAGVGYTLGEAWITTGDDRYRVAMDRAFDQLGTCATLVDAGATWGDCNDVISGTAGIGFAFAWAGEHRLRSADQQCAVRAASALHQRAQVLDDRADWPMDASLPRRMPNFSHGTSGVAALLSRVSLHADWWSDTSFLGPAPKFPHGAARVGADVARLALARLGGTLKSAERGAAHLIAIADRTNGGFVVGHDTPDNPTLMYMGWCHGPCGTARLFRELYVATHEDKWRDLELACAKSVMTCGLPEERLPGFWNNVSRCCGDAGVIEFMLDLYAETKDAQYLEFAQRVGRDVLSRATRDENGMRWVQAEHRVKPELLVAQTGLMQGAAGIALALVHLDEAERGIAPVIRLPDEPPR